MDKAAIVTLVSQYKGKTVSPIGAKLQERTQELLDKGKKL